MRTKHTVNMGLCGLAVSLAVSPVATTAAADVRIDGRQLVEMVHAVDWPGVTVWAFEDARAAAQTIMVVNGTGERIMITNGAGQLLRTVKPGVTVELRPSQCGSNGVLALVRSVDQSATLFQCLAGRYYHLKTSIDASDVQEVRP